MLVQIFRELNGVHFEASLPEPVLEWNSRLRSSAGRFTPGSRNLIRPRAAKIEIASYLRELSDGERHIRDTLLHEMIHFFLWHGKKPYGHTPEFHAIMKRVGATRYNPVPKLRPVKHWYECPGCQTRFPARRKLQPSACAPCCRKWNQGEYSERFLLRIVEGPNASTIEVKEDIFLSREETWSRLEMIKRLIAEKVTARK